MPKPAAADEIWPVDLGLTAKVRPCLVMSDYPAQEELHRQMIHPVMLLFHFHKETIRIKLLIGLIVGHGRL